MKVSELIAELESEDPDKPVCIEGEGLQARASWVKRFGGMILIGHGNPEDWEDQ